MGELRGTHVPVLLERCLELLAPACELPNAVHVDFTLGLGGHAEAVLERFPDVVLIGLDRDTEALTHARHRLAPFRARTHLVHAVYDELPVKPRVLTQMARDRHPALLVRHLVVRAREEHAAVGPGSLVGHRLLT